MNEIKMIPINKLFPHKDNPRKNLGDLTELSDSIRTNGIMQNLTVIPNGKVGYTVLIGHRRLEAAKLAGLSELPCAVVEMDEREQVATMLLENIQRSDLTVWEQAKGFQMMLDLGDTVEGISEKTGFSKSTIHRRLKIAELDEKAYKESEERQITLTEYLNLSEIEDIKQRNKLLKSLGTPNFEWEFKRAMQEQELNTAMEPIMPALKERHIKKIDGSEWRYKCLKTIPFKDFSPDLLVFDEEVENLYYGVNSYTKSVVIYTYRPEEKKAEQDPKVKELQQRADKAKEDMNALKAMAYNLRKDFAVGLRLTAKNAPLILRGSLMANILADYYNSAQTPFLLDEVFPLSDGETPTKDIYGGERQKRFIQRLTDNPSMAPCFVYIFFEDGKDQGYGKEHYVGKAWVPYYRGSDKLDAIYDWLISLGYQMSDEEKALRDGTHEIYHRFDAEIAAEESVDDDDYDEEEDDIDEDEILDEEDEDIEED